MTFPSLRAGNPVWSEENQVLGRLIVVAATGDVTAFEQLYERTARIMLYHVRRLVRDGHAEDVLAEVYLRIWQSLSKFDPARSPPAAWMALIARSMSLDHLRRQRRMAEVEDADSFTAEPSTPGPDHVLCELESREMVLLGLACAPLSERERLIVGLAYFRDNTQQEIAQLTGMPLGTVKSAMKRGLAKLRVHLCPPDTGAAAVSHLMRQA